jgi:hypothetical protein
MKTDMKIFKILLLALFVLPLSVFSQEEDKDKVKEKPERPAFEGAWLIDNPTNVVFDKNTLEVMMQHRFDEINFEDNNLAGLYGAANIRIALAYSIHDRLTLGYGTSKLKSYQDFNWKVSLLQQTRQNFIPVSVSYYGNFVIDARQKDKGYFVNIQDRYSFFHQLIIAKRFSPKFSLQLAPSISHFNKVDEALKNDMYSVALGGRYKISPNTAIVFDYSQPLTQYQDNTEVPAGLSLGAEFATSSHVFQVFVTNLWGIVPQHNYMYNDKNNGINGESGQYLIGFNITRNYNF